MNTNIIEGLSLPFELRFSKDNTEFNLRSTDGKFKYSNIVVNRIFEFQEDTLYPLKRRTYYAQSCLNKLAKCPDGKENELLQLLYDSIEEMALVTSIDTVDIGNLIMALLNEQKRKFPNSRKEYYEIMETIHNQVHTLMFVKLVIDDMLSELSKMQKNANDRSKLPNIEELKPFEAKVRIEYINGKRNHFFLIETIDDYINLLVYSYFTSKPMLSFCENCNRYFTPKTKRVTLFCDRVTDDGLSCKKIGPKKKHLQIIHSDPVYKKYNAEKHRIQVYCNRGKQDEHDFIYDYYDWLEMFENKFYAYKCGKYDGEILIKEIENETPNFQPYSKGKNFAEDEGY